MFIRQYFLSVKIDKNIVVLCVRVISYCDVNRPHAIVANRDLVIAVASLLPGNQRCKLVQSIHSFVNFSLHRQKL